MFNNTRRHLLRILLSNNNFHYVQEPIINNNNNNNSITEMATNRYINTSLNENISISLLSNQNNNEILSIGSASVFQTQILVPLHVIIFILSIVGNSLVLFTLLKNKSMRTVTNVYLLNLAVANLLLGVICMPFTLVGQVLQKFIFGKIMCKLIPYFQAVSVSVPVWTLVAISLERYFAICRPLKSRRWQTRCHASKMTAIVWLASFIWCGPIVVVSTLQRTKRGYKCRELWPSTSSEIFFNLFLDIILLLMPFTIMCLAYFMIAKKLRKGLQTEIGHNSCQKLLMQRSTSSSSIPDQSPKRKGFSIFSKKEKQINKSNHSQQQQQENQHNSTAFSTSSNTNGILKPHPATTCTYTYCRGFVPMAFETSSTTYIGDSLKQKGSLSGKETTYTFTRSAIRSNNIHKSIKAKRKVIRMLFVVVAEFFICWTPIHVINTCYTFYPKEVYQYVGPTGISLIQLLSYISACSNPITYCFMNRKFRQTFITAFKCSKLCKDRQTPNTTERVRNVVLKKAATSENSCNESTLYLGRISSTGRSESEAEDRV